MDKESLERLEAKVDDIREKTAVTKVHITEIKTKLEIADVIDLRRHVDFVRRGSKFLLALIAVGGTLMGIYTQSKKATVRMLNPQQTLHPRPLDRTPKEGYPSLDPTSSFRVERSASDTVRSPSSGS